MTQGAAFVYSLTSLCTSIQQKLGKREGVPKVSGTYAALDAFLHAKGYMVRKLSVSGQRSAMHIAATLCSHHLAVVPRMVAFLPTNVSAARALRRQGVATYQW